jgi:hypothetical protein
VNNSNNRPSLSTWCARRLSNSSASSSCDSATPSLSTCYRLQKKQNWLFNWTELGARHVGIVQSLLATCRLHDINPYDYFVDVLQRVDLHPASLLHQLTPRIWKTMFPANPLRSDLHDVGGRRTCATARSFT